MKDERVLQERAVGRSYVLLLCVGVSRIGYVREELPVGPAVPPVPLQGTQSQRLR